MAHGSYKRSRREGELAVRVRSLDIAPESSIIINSLFLGQGLTVSIDDRFVTGCQPASPRLSIA